MITVIKLLLIGIHTIILSIIATFSALVDRSFKSYFFLTKIFSKGILFIAGVKVETINKNKIDNNSTYVFVSNHLSQFDIPVLQSAIPNRIAMIFKKELSRIPIFGWQLVLGPHIMVNRKSPESGMKSIEQAKERMKAKGISVLVFPEGTRSKTGDLLPFKRGAFHLASKIGAPIVPVTIINSEKIMPKGSFKLKRGNVKVIFNDPIDTSNIKSKPDEIQLMEKIKLTMLNNKENYR
ncbi:MAG: 1-acyl-sn-glycerol-3-phosphate acyltransferase [Ignavibacterium sp.]|nr:1-acyl-sn-glycerol-3-phosphate acyltransferase [Ignavibacterium sp.]MDW8375249.1 lysophospholipid acyltransferase family protein [Ignavibacteriales bacterium]